jgi:hypothetical protein
MGSSSPEDMKKGMEAWNAWAEKCGSGLVDLGQPLANGMRVTPGGTSPSDRGVAGYSILQAEDINGAVAMLQGHPHLGWDDSCDIEVHEAMPLPS